MKKFLIKTLIIVGIIISLFLLWYFIGFVRALIDPDFKEIRNCSRNGGRIESYRGGKKFCNMPTKDGGKICADESECEEGCLATSYDFQNWKEAENIHQGKCAEWEVNLGCHAYLKNGRIYMSWCAE